MHHINAKERAWNNLNNYGAGAKRQARMFKLFHARLYCWSFCFLLVVVLLPISASHAEWIKATPSGASDDIWINTESNALYSGNNCRSLMKLKHLSGRKPRNLRQRQQAHVKKFGKQHHADGANNAKQTNRKNNSPHADGVDRQDGRAAGAPLDALNLSYQTQPEVDPLNRNRFNISITDNNIVLTNQHIRINARISGRYDHRPECGF